ncbi:MAG: glycosyltransferase family 87 protein [Bacteroidia bacterium]
MCEESTPTAVRNSSRSAQVRTMNKQSYTNYLLLLLAVIYILIEADGRGDFYIFLSASEDLFKGENIYTKMYVDGYHYLYSLFFAVILKPLSYFPLYLSKVLWLAMNLFFLYRIWKILCSYFELSRFSQKQLMWFTLLSFAFSLRFIRDNFHLAQMTTFMLFLSLEGIQLIRKDKKLAGAALLALGINIKLLPIVLLPYLLWRKEFKTFLYCIGIYILLFLFPAIFIGYDQTLFLMKEWWKVVNPSQEQHIIDVSERSFHSLSTLLPTLLMEKVPDIYALDMKRNIASLTAEKVNLILNSARFLLIGFTLYFLRNSFMKTFGSKLNTIWELSYIVLLIPLIFPHQQHYAFLFTMPASSYLIYYLFLKRSGMKKRNFMIMVAALSLIYLCFNLNLILGEFKAYYEHYKIITYGALLLIPMLAVCKPENLKAYTDQ